MMVTYLFVDNSGVHRAHQNAICSEATDAEDNLHILFYPPYLPLFTTFYHFLPPRELAEDFVMSAQSFCPHLGLNFL